MIATETAWVEAYNLGRERGYFLGRLGHKNRDAYSVGFDDLSADDLLADLLAETSDKEIIYEAFGRGYANGQNLASFLGLFTTT